MEWSDSWHRYIRIGDTLVVSISATPAGTATISAIIGGSTAITLNGAGALVLSGDNTFSGGTTITTGTLRVGHDRALGSAGLTLNGGGLSNAGASAITIANDLSLTADIGLGSATFAGALDLTGAVDFTGTTRTLTVASGVSLSGVVSNGGLTKAGTGALTLNAANTYAGDTTVSAGSLLQGRANALGAVTNLLTVGTAGTVDLKGFALTVSGLANISGAGGVVTNTGSAATLTLDGSVNKTFAGAITGAIALSKVGTFTQILTGANSFTGGTTLTEGKLELGAVNALGGDLVVDGGLHIK